ncbi:MAG: hypothetical protein HYY93_13995, partial [Planctomycetes bacterium]|nr:hypothetical protein [Planctomycetota bacterium]
MSPDPQGPEHGLQPTPDPAPERTPPSSALRWIIGLSLVVTISIATCLLGGTRFPFSLFWNPVAGVLVVNLTFALLLMTYSVGEILGTLMLPLSAPGRHREERLHRLESCALSGSRYSLSAG